MSQTVSVFTLHHELHEGGKVKFLCDISSRDDTLEELLATLDCFVQGCGFRFSGSLQIVGHGQEVVDRPDFEVN